MNFLRMFPIRVVVQTIDEQECTKCAHSGINLVDSYAIVNGQTPMSQLVDTVLSALGLQHLSYAAKGMVELNNWKALPFETITNDMENTTEMLLKDISNHATLKILTKTADSALGDCVRDLRQRLLRATLNRNPQILSTIKNAQLKEFVSQLLEDEPISNVSPEQIQGFNHWIEEVTTNKTSLTNVSNGPHSPTLTGPHTTNGIPGLQSLTNIVRFNPQLEIPKLERWYRENPNPTRQKLLQYVQILNTTNYRRHHSKVNYQQICNWFSNMRALHRNQHTQSPTNSSSNGGLNKVFGSDVRSTSFDFNELLRRQQEKSEYTGEDVIENTESSNAVETEIKQEEAETAIQTQVPEHNGIQPEVQQNSEQVSPVSSDELSMNHSMSSMSNNTYNQGVTGVGRSRLMFDPLSELPLLEKWFEENPHPSWIQIDQYTEALNSLSYRQTYPPISTHNVKIWFKNRRAKSKRMLGTDRKYEQLP